MMLEIITILCKDFMILLLGSIFYCLLRTNDLNSARMFI